MVSKNFWAVWTMQKKFEFSKSFWDSVLTTGEDCVFSLSLQDSVDKTGEV